MPRKTAKVTRAETFLRWWGGVERLSATGGIKLSKFPLTDAYRLVDPANDFAIDAQLREAIDGGFLADDLIKSRGGLFFAFLDAGVGAAVRYEFQISRPANAKRREMAASLAEALRRFVAIVEEDAEALEGHGETWADPSIDTGDLRAICSQGQTLAPLLDEYAQPPARDWGNATGHEEHAFFKALREWWRENAIAPEKRGAKAARNNIAISFWTDFWVPGAGDVDERWAARNFRRLGEN